VSNNDRPETFSLVLPDEIHPLREALLQAEIRKMAAEAEQAELELTVKKDEERDRLVKTGRIRHLEVNGAIGGSTHDKWMDALRHWSLRDAGQPVTITINTQGGSITDGLAMYDMIQRLRDQGSHVTVRASGMAASMGAVLLQAGTERLIDPHAKILIHEGSIMLAGNVNLTRGEQEDMRVFQDMLIDDILDIMAERSNLSKRQIQTRWRRKDWWMGAEEAVKLGFADRIE